MRTFQRPLFDPKEEWRDVPEYEGILQVSSKGRVRSLYILQPAIRSGTGYLGIAVPTFEKGVYKQKSRNLHSLVAAAFLGPRPEGCQVNHIDGVKTNAHPDNLEYVTQSENIQHRFRLQRSKHNLNQAQLDRISQLFFEEGYYPTEIGKELGLPYVVITGAIRQYQAQGRKKRKKKFVRRTTADIVLKIREMWTTGKYTQRDLGKLFDLTGGQVSRIVRGEQWKHLLPKVEAFNDA